MTLTAVEKMVPVSHVMEAAHEGKAAFNLPDGEQDNSENLI